MQVPSTLTVKQREILERGGISGVCSRYVWKWMQDGRPITAQVNALIAKGYLIANYYPGNIAGIGLTDTGRAVLAKDDAAK